MSAAASPLPEPAPHASSELLAGRYRRLAQLGAREMGAVYRVADAATGRELALKQLLSGDGGRKKRALDALFEREYHTLVLLEHPRIIEVYDYGLTADGPYYTMELLDGNDLGELAPLPHREACRHLRDLASALALIHAHRLVHRDVSPRNVRIDASGRAKLIDFGALTPFGTAPEVIGTPPCVAPEVLRRVPLDQRADLYSLGAVAYYLLTGEHAFPARQHSELPALWTRPPPPPSLHAPDVPPALDALVLSLLAIDRMARPSHTAQVVEQLVAIGELELEHADVVADSYLQSSHTVGRDEELSWVRKRIARAADGRGTAILLEGPAGIGRTRLLHELALEAQLRGLCALKADAQATRGELGVAIALALDLLTAAPELALRAAGEHAPQLARLSHELRAKLDVAAPAELAEDPAERRARAQTALHAWFLAVARAQPLLIAVDNVHAADDSSAAFLAALGRQAREHALIVLVSQRSHEQVIAPAPVRALRMGAARLELGALDARACSQLVESLFGCAANVERVGALLRRKSAGNPQLCMDLAHLLVRKGIAKYQAGAWVLPLDVSDDELPTGPGEILGARLAALSPAARQLAEGLSIHDKPIALEHALDAREGRDERAAHAALDELVAEQFLLVEDAEYRFCHEAMRQAVLAGIDPVLRRAKHMRAAEALLENAELHVGAQLEAAWHLIRAGREWRGADILAAAAREFLRDKGAAESADQVVRALDTAISVYEAQGRSKHERAGLLFALIPLAFFSSFRVTLARGEGALRLGLDITGLALAAKLSRVMPRKLALLIGLCTAGVRLALQRNKGVSYSLPEAIGALCALVPATVGAHNLCYDVAAVQRMEKLLAPLTLFGEGHFASLMYEWARGQLALGQARQADARAALEAFERGLQSDAIEKLLGESRWRSLYGGLSFSLGILAPHWFGTRALELADRMEALGVRVWAMAAAQVRLLHHALRGESEALARQRERVELFALQGSTSWQSEMYWPVLLLASDALVGDTLAVRRARDQLARRAQDAPSLQLYADLADAVYLTLRGEHDDAIARFEQLLPELAIKQRAAWHTARSLFAEALNGAGQHQRAKAVLQEMLAALGPEDRAVVGCYLEPRRKLALTEAALGNHALAAELLDGLLAEHGAQDQPLLIGLLHKARAEVALQTRDASAFERHAAEMETRFHATQNACLIAQWERLIERAVRAGVRERNEAVSRSSRPGDPSRSSMRVARELAAAPDPAQHAVHLLVERMRASAAHLYELRGGQLRLLESSRGSKPARELEAELLLRHQRAQTELREEQSAEDRPTVLELAPEVAPSSVFLDSDPPVGPRAQLQTILLQHVHAGVRSTVGGLILEFPADTTPNVDPALIDAIASILHDRRMLITR